MTQRDIGSYFTRVPDNNHPLSVCNANVRLHPELEEAKEARRRQDIERRSRALSPPPRQERGSCSKSSKSAVDVLNTLEELSSDNPSLSPTELSFRSSQNSEVKRYQKWPYWKKRMVVQVHERSNSGWLSRDVKGRGHLGSIEGTVSHMKTIFSSDFKGLSWSCFNDWLKLYKTSYQTELARLKPIPIIRVGCEKAAKEYAMIQLQGKRAASLASQLKISSNSVPQPLYTAIQEKIMEQVESGVPGLNSNTLQPILLAFIKDSPWAGLLHGRVGGWFKCCRSWIRRVCRKMDLRVRAATTAAQKLPDDYKEQLDLWRMQITHEVYTKKIPEALVVNADQTGIFLVPAYKSPYLQAMLAMHCLHQQHL
ncbi:hypothetical protein CEUSTIGMA_g8230.t1 [Chlamydomonas eustigma]|uniref:Uncharacterized protein n=1 Tax=Chlamydomonas eustigma TaxID=1157962 RepID=A0A250XCK9_9CHLO|nr:hypothetical protein CEUSTIGMA_g8230.t1 [Chlamydomonas eustigma]|eukprot:GAX80794.1 hypothetical protein CEUSTIGMA_g8230.t1 [Chlamydomonas eustigma]